METNVKITFDKQELINSKTFKEDGITKAVNDFNMELGWGKCRGIEIEALDEYHPIVNVGGFKILKKTFIKLVEEEIIKIN